jgi:uncharacterized membrane protein
MKQLTIRGFDERLGRLQGPLCALIAASALAGSSVHAEVLRGRLVFGHEGRSFQPCGDARTLWVSARGEALERLRRGYAELAQASYEAIYAEIQAVELEERPGELAAEYDGAIEVQAVHTLSRQVPAECVASPARSADREPAPGEPPLTYVFVCGDGEAVTVRIADGVAWAFLRDGTRRLRPVNVEGAARWTDGEITLEVEAPAATIGTIGGPTRVCRNDPRRAAWEHAKLGGADFRAVGNEPGWDLEIREQSRIVLVADYVSVVVERALPQPQVDAEASTTRWEAGDLVVEVRGEPCTDTMSGEVFESTVTVYWGDRTLRGCGRALH